MSDKQETIEILVIKQDDKPIRKTIPNTLEAKQHEVGGYIEPYGLKNGATIYCNEEGKLAVGASTVQSGHTTSMIGPVRKSWK